MCTYMYIDFIVDQQWQMHKIQMQLVHNNIMSCVTRKPVGWISNHFQHNHNAACTAIENDCMLEFLNSNVEGSFCLMASVFLLLVHLSRRLVCDVIVHPWSGVSPVSVVVHNFNHEYLFKQWADHNEILSESSLGWEKGCIRFWVRLDIHSGFHGNR